MPRVILLTGRSDPARTGLPAAQTAFLRAVTPRWAEPVLDGYPWEGGAQEQFVPLVLAGWRNFLQWQAARRGRTRTEAAAGLARVKRGRMAVITGSCGLDLLQSGWTDGVGSLVIAIGPVTRRRPIFEGAQLITVVGRRDGLARALHCDLPDHRVPCDHMGYWTCAETRSVVADELDLWAKTQ